MQTVLPPCASSPADPTVEPSPLGENRLASRMGSRVLQRSGASLGYEVRLARSVQEVEAAQALRFRVFNLELQEGLAESYRTGRDEDPFDAICDHLLVTYAGEVVGTYRLQTGLTAGRNLGYYSASEFDLAPFEAERSRVVELGRACVERGHRRLPVLGLLWRGIAAYARERNGRYLIGCGSLTSQVEADGEAVYRALAGRHLAPPAWQTAPRPEYICASDEATTPPPRVPGLLSAYLSLGAQICGRPAIDREFQTIDFLTLLDLESLAPEVAEHLF
jgi:putative hemolysin